MVVGGLDEYTRLVFQQGRRGPGIQRVAIFEVTHRAGRLIDREGDPGVPLGADARRPLTDLPTPGPAFQSGLIAPRWLVKT